MASSNRHWPSLFKSKPCNTTSTIHHQWQQQQHHDINHSSLMSSFQKPTSGFEERSPDPKPRWNPKPEQIRILETIFNSGLVNPPRDEIRRIRTQLQEYGQVGDANIFYWFQNRKSRSKNKQKHLQNTKSSSSSSSEKSSAVTQTAPSSSSSSSSEKSSPPNCTSHQNPFPMEAPVVTNLTDVSNSPTASVNQLSFFQTSTNQECSPHDPFFFPVQQTGLSFSELANVVQFPEIEESIGGTYSGLLLGELIMNHGAALRKVELEQSRKFIQEQLQLNYIIPTPAISSLVAAPINIITSTTDSTTINQIQGVGESDEMAPAAAGKSTVFINDVAINISVGPLNVRQSFGDDVVLIHPSGQPVLTNEWGVTLQSLTPGAFYYLVPLTC